MKKIQRLYSLFLLFTVSLSVLAQGPNNTGTYYSNADGKKGAALKTALTTSSRARTSHRTTDLSVPTNRPTPAPTDASVTGTQTSPTTATAKIRADTRKRVTATTANIPCPRVGSARLRR